MPCVLPFFFFFLFSVRKFAFSLAFLFFTSKSSLLLAYFLYRSTVQDWFHGSRIGNLWRIFRKFRVRNIVNSFRRGSGKFETFENLSELNGEAVFFWQRIKRWSQFHEYLRNKRFGKKKKKRNEVEGNGKVITCFLQGKNFHKISLLNISKDKFKFVSLAIQVVNYIL